MIFIFSLLHENIEMLAGNLFYVLNEFISHSNNLAR